MGEKVFGYLLITPNSLNNIDAVKRDYWNSVRAMKDENALRKTNYSCYVGCINCSWWFRRKIAKKIGIPMKKVNNVKYLQSPKNKYGGFDIVVAADSMVDDTFFGKMKVYDSECNIPRAEINSCIEVVYEC